MQAIGLYIVITPIAEEIKTSGLIMAGQDKNEIRYKKAKVVSPGTDVTAVKSGDEIYYDTRNAFSMVVNQETYTVIIQRDVVLVN